MHKSVTLRSARSSSRCTSSTTPRSCSAATTSTRSAPRSTSSQPSTSTWTSSTSSSTSSPSLAEEKNKWPLSDEKIYLWTIYLSISLKALGKSDNTECVIKMLRLWDTRPHRRCSPPSWRCCGDWDCASQRSSSCGDCDDKMQKCLQT